LLTREAIFFFASLSQLENCQIRVSDLHRLIGNPQYVIILFFFIVNAQLFCQRSVDQERVLFSCVKLKSSIVTEVLIVWKFIFSCEYMESNNEPKFHLRLFKSSWPFDNFHDIVPDKSLESFPGFCDTIYRQHFSRFLLWVYKGIRSRKIKENLLEME
jgi:hypothetical protein